MFLKGWTRTRIPLKILQTEYLDKGSPGLKEFIGRHHLTAELLAQAIFDNPKDYKYLDSMYIYCISQEKKIYKYPDKIC